MAWQDWGGTPEVSYIQSHAGVTVISPGLVSALSGVVEKNCVATRTDFAHAETNLILLLSFERHDFGFTLREATEWCHPIRPEAASKHIAAAWALR
jgi:hypothetical protein